MRLLSYIPVLFLFLPWNPGPLTNPYHSENVLSKSEFDWLVGDWQRLNDRPGRTTFEHWTKISSFEYHGLGYTLRNGDTIFKENMKLHIKNGKWIFEVSGVNEDPTLFVVSEKARRSFTCENEKNEFPKYIEYSLDGRTLKARIYGDGQEVLFSFERQ
jgi:hypothetical protein